MPADAESVEPGCRVGIADGCERLIGKLARSEWIGLTHEDHVGEPG